MKRKQIKRLENNTFILRRVMFGDFRDLIGKRFNVQFFNPIKIGEYALSVQASECHYCNPRVNTNIEDYKSMEVALFNNKGWSRPSKIKGVEKYDDLWESSHVSVAGYVDINVIQNIFNILSAKHN